MDFNVKNYGALGDGKTFDTQAIQSAIDACTNAGGGRVIIGGGTYLTGTIVLKENVNLHIEADGVLLASPNVKDFPEFPKKHVDVNKLPRFQGAAMIFAEECANISITGKGTIDANGYAFVEECEPYHAGWRYRRINKETLPRVVFFTGCKNILVEDITMINSPAGWSYWIHDCDFVNFDKIKILCSLEFPNNDGIHINSSRDVTVSNCFISTGDDSIIIRAANRSLEKPKICERITITNCTLKSHTNAVRIGWIGDGTIRNCTLSNLCIDETRMGIAIVLPKFRGNNMEEMLSYKVESGEPKPDGMSDFGLQKTLIENISFSNITMSNIYLRPIHIQIVDSETTSCEAIRNLYFNNIYAQALGFPLIIGRENCLVQNIKFNGCDFRKVQPAQLTYYVEGILKNVPQYLIEYAENVAFNNTTFSSEGQ